MNDSNEDEYSSDSDGSDNGNEKLSHGEHKERGNACYKLKDYRGAIAWYTLAIETSNSGSDSGSSDIVEKDVLATYYNNRAAASTMMLLYSDALSDCDAILSFHPSFVKALLRKAKVLTILGRLEEANQLYSEALVLDHSNVNVNLQKEVKTLLQRVALIQSLLQLPNTTTNTSNSNTITSTSNSKEWLLPILAISKANASQAMKQIALILTKCPNYNDLLSLQLQAHIVLQQYNDVITTSNKIIRQNQKNSISNNNNNNSMMLSSSVSNLSANTSTSTSTSTQSSLSTSIIQQQQQQHSDNIIIYRAYAFYQIGKIDDAIKHLKQILSLDPDHKVAFTLHKALRTIIKLKEKADAMYKGRNYREAITLYTEALETRAAEQSKGVYKAKLYFNRASAYANLANTKTATTTDDDDDDDDASVKDCHTHVIQDCTNALELDDTYIKCYTRRGSSYLIIGEQCSNSEEEESYCRKAIADFESALDLCTNNAQESDNDDDDDDDYDDSRSRRSSTKSNRSSSNTSLSTSTKAQKQEIKKKLQHAQVQMKRCKQKDFYKILSLSKQNATQDQIKKSYRKAALKWHPDRHANSSEEKKKEAEVIFRDVNLAYEVLSDVEKKRKYDLGVDVEDLDNPHAGHGGGGHHRHHGGHGGIDHNILFEMFMRQQHGGMGGMHFG